MLGYRAYVGAIQVMTRSLRARADGIGANDWVTDAAAGVVICQMIDGLTAYAQSLLGE